MGKRRARQVVEQADPGLREVNATEAKNNFGTVLIDVLRGDRLQINRNGHPVAVIVGYDQFRDMVGDPHHNGGNVMESLHEIAATEAKNNFGTLLMNVLGGQRFVVRRNTRLQGVILDYADYHGIWQHREGRAPAGNGDT